MSKRFFSLLLVLVMVLSFAAPALAANDGISTIERGDLEKDPAPGAGRKALVAALDLHLAGAYSLTSYPGTNKLNGDETYTAASWTRFDNAMKAGIELKDKYESKREVLDADMQKAADDISAAFVLLSKAATTDDKAALKAVIDEAQALVDSGTLLDATKTSFTTATSGYIDAAKAIYDKTNATHKEICEPMRGAIDTLKKHIDDAKRDGISQQTAYIKEAKWDAENSKVVYTIELTDQKDDFKYAVIASLNGGTPVQVWPDESPERGDTYAYSNSNVAAQGSAKNIAKELFDYAKKLTASDTITLTLVYAGAGDREHPHSSVTVGSVNVPCTTTPESSTAPAVKASGFVANAAQNPVDGKIRDIDGNEVSSAAAAHDTFYVVLNQSVDSMLQYMVDDGQIDTGCTAKWVITAPDGSVVNPAQSSTSQTEYKFTSGSFSSADIKLGTYKIDLFAQKSGKADVLVVTTNVTIKKLDKSSLSKYISDLGLSDHSTIASNFGPYDNVTNLLKTLNEADAYIAKDETPIKDHYFKAGGTDNKGTGLGEAGMKRGDETGEFYKIYKDYLNVVDLRALKSAIDQAEALNKNAYQNWSDGLMKQALANAKAAYTALTSDKKSVDLNGDGQPEDITTCDFYLVGETEKVSGGVTRIGTAGVATLVSELQTAIKWLDGTANPDEKDGLYVEDGKLYLYVGGEKQMTGRTEWPAGSGIYYYFSVKDGHAFKNGVVSAGGTIQYVADSEGILQKGYTKVGSDAYYCSVKDNHIYKNGIVSAGGTRQYIAGKDGKLLKDKQTVGSNSYYCSVKDHHIFKAINNTAWVTGTVAKYQVNAKGVILATKPLKG